jgi:hypothetical protein
MSKTVGNATGQGQDYTVATGSGVVDADTQRVSIATDNVVHIDDNSSTISVDDGAGSLTVDGTVAATQSGTWNVGTVTSVTNVVHVDDNAGSLTVDNPVISVVGGGTEATAQRVTIATDSTGVLSVDDNGGSLTVDGTVAVSGTVAVTDNSGSLTVDAPAGTPVFVRLSDGAAAITALPITDNSGSLTVDGTVAATQSGTWNVGTVTTVTNVVHVDDNAGSLTVDGAVTVSGTATVTGNKAEDAASADGDAGFPVLAVRKASPANTSGTDGDYEFLQMSAGRVWASATIDAALPAGSAVIGKVSIDQTTPGTTNLVALAANQSVNQAQIAGTTVDTNSGNKSAGTQRIVIATDQPNLTSALNVTSVVTSLPASTNTLEVVGDVAEDAAIAGNPVRQGVRAHSGVPTAMSTNDDVVSPWADLSGAQVVIPQPRTVLVQATPTIATSGYVAGDQVGGLLTFTSAALASGRAGQIVSATLTTRAPTATNALELWLFEASPTIASSDNAAFDLTDANLEAGKFCGIVLFSTADYAVSSSNGVVVGTGKPIGSPLPTFVTSGSANLFGVLVARTVSAQYAGTTDVVVSLRITQF